jgi:hypothetical protein
MRNLFLQSFIFFLLSCFNVDAQKKPLIITYHYTSYGGHESEQVLKLLEGR